MHFRINIICYGGMQRQLLFMRRKACDIKVSGNSQRIQKIAK
uniref:Uncharacterized protein n=1 Tax=Arundo donax TaxID=35708 RepID=A0A0A9B8P7_ARUDO